MNREGIPAEGTKKPFEKEMRAYFLAVIITVDTVVVI